jgi:hypothetical protein
MQLQLDARGEEKAMRGLVLAMALLAAGAARADEQGRKFLLATYAEVLAIAELCPDLIYNSIRMSRLALVSGVDVKEGGSDFGALQALTIERFKFLEADPRVCANGWQQYGPQGNSLKGMLIKK